MDQDTSSRASQFLKFLLELVVYGLLVVVYFLVVLRFLTDPLVAFYEDNVIVYAFLSLGLIIAQAVVLESIVNLLMNILGLSGIE